MFRPMLTRMLVHLTRRGHGGVAGEAGVAAVRPGVDQRRLRVRLPLERLGLLVRLRGDLQDVPLLLAADLGRTP